MRIAVLAVQGAFLEHEKMLRSLGVDCFEIRQPKDLNTGFDGMILPGGESTVMGKLLRELSLFEPINQKIKSGMPVFGTCAGMILLAHTISNDDRSYFKSMSVAVRRNAYGRQLGSFETKAEFKGIGQIPMVFIRAPFIEKVWGDAKVLATVDGNAVAARQANCLATAFHPELTDDLSVHKYFLDMVRERLK